jgi:hypothetical protein
MRPRPANDTQQTAGESHITYQLMLHLGEDRTTPFPRVSADSCYTIFGVRTIASHRLQM